MMPAGLMNTINDTWPHPDHIFVNIGKGGACLETIAEGTCLSAYTPQVGRGGRRRGSEGGWKGGSGEAERKMERH